MTKKPDTTDDVINKLCSTDNVREVQECKN